MTDHFATLGLPRAPWLEAELVKERFHRLSASRHPDAGGSAEAFAELNAAWQTLREPAARLRHFLELEHPEALAAAGKTPAELGDLFMEVAGNRQAASQLAARLAAASSPLSRSLLEPERRQRRESLEKTASKVDTRLESAQSRLQGGEADPSVLASLLATLVFLGKWAAQLRESRLGLD